MPLALYDDDRANEESSILTAPSSGIGMAPSGAVAPGMELGQQNSGIGIAPASPAGGAVGPIGIWGALKESFTPVARARAARRQDRELQLRERETKINEFKSQVDALKVGVELLNDTTGGERAQFVASYAKRLESIDPGLGATFTSLAEKPDVAAEIMEWGQDSESLKRAYEVGGVKGVRRLLEREGALKTIQSEMDAKRLPTLMKKAQSFIANWQQIVSPEMAEEFNKDGRLSASELARANEWIKENKPELVKGLGISDRDWSVIHRNADAFYGALGIVPPKEEGKLAVDKAKKGDEPPKTQTVKVMVNGAVHDQRQVWRGGAWANEGESTPHHKPEEGGLPKEVKDKVAAIQMKVLDGKQPTTEERAFLDEVARTNPFFSAMRDVLGGGGAGPAAPRPAPTEKTAPEALVKRFNADAKMKGNKLGAKTAKGWEVKNAAGKLIGYYE